MQATFIDSLDQHQGASTALLTGVLVLITGYYAFQNRAMVQEMKHARDAALLPKLALDFHRLGPTAMTLAIRNVGPGAALDVDVTVTWEPLTEGSPPQQRWRRNVLAHGEQADFMPPGETVNDSLNHLPMTYRRVLLDGTMKDAAGKEHTVAEVFEDLKEWRKVLGDAHQRYVIPDAEKRAADEFAKRFEPHLRGMQQALREVAARLPTPEGE